LNTGPAVAMLLLDHNLPHQLQELLATYGFKAETDCIAWIGTGYGTVNL
jgi:hypothetical protein